MNKFMEELLEKIMFHGRWLLAPIYLGLVGTLLLLLLKFVQEFYHFAFKVFDFTQPQLVLAILELVDISLMGNLLLMVIFSGYENFVSRIDIAKDSVDRPHWMGKVGYSGLKIKLIGSIVAISAIDLLKAFMNEATPGIDNLSSEELAWMLAIHLLLIVSGVLFALMDRIAPEEG